MKRIRKFLVAASLLLVVLCLTLSLASPLSAYAAETAQRKTNYKKPDKKPTYTETLNENNKLLNELTKKENALLKYTKESGKDWVNVTVDILDAIKNGSVEDTDWDKIGIEAGKDIIVAIAGIWGFGGVADAVLEGVEQLTSSGSAPLSETQVLAEEITQQFNAMSDRLSDIEEQLSALSNQITASADQITSATQAQIDNLDAKQYIRSFMMGGYGDFSYLDFSNYLYGTENKYVSSTEAYYVQLLEAICTQAPDEIVQYYYDHLFNCVYPGIAKYSQYYFDEVAGADKSIAAYYYDYVSYNPELLSEGTSVTYESLMFALDLYTTYVYAYELLEMCFAYQTMQMYITDTAYYDTGEYLVSVATIEAELAHMQEYLADAEVQIAKDIAYILEMENSYIVMDEDDTVHEFGNYGDSFGNVVKGQTVYLNLLPDEICEMFLLDKNKVTCYVNETLYSGARKGVVAVNSDQTFCAEVRYGEVTLYTIDFTVDATNSFSGGSGTEEDPYLISNAEQLLLVKEDLSACYRLIRDIDLKDRALSPIGTESVPFSGCFDGNGHTISNVTVNSLGYDEKNITMTPTTGLFGTLTGTVEQLTVESIVVNSLHDVDQVYPENDVSYYYIGGIVGHNKGKVHNCIVTQTAELPSAITVVRMKSCAESKTVEVCVGGIAGKNDGTVQYCTVDGLKIDAKSNLYYYNEPVRGNKHFLYVGGIAGFTHGRIANCRVSENTHLSAYAYSEAYSSDEEKPYVTVWVAGIANGEDVWEKLSNVYSACKIDNCKGEIWNKGTYWSVNRYTYDNASVKQGLYYATCFPASGNSVASAYEQKYFEKQLSVFLSNTGYSTYAYTLLDDYINSLVLTDQEVAETNLAGKTLPDFANEAFSFAKVQKPEFSVSAEGFVYAMNTAYLDTGKIRISNAEGQTVAAEIVAYYGFDTSHTSEKAKSIPVTIFYYVEHNSEMLLLSDEVVLTVEGKELVGRELLSFEKTEFLKGTTEEDFLITVLEDEFVLAYHYNNGDVESFTIKPETADTVIVEGFDASTIREIMVTVSHELGDQLYKFAVPVSIVCGHQMSDFALREVVPATCLSEGYEIHACTKNGGCGKTIEKNFFAGDHDYVVVDGAAPTCHEPGYTYQITCATCGVVLSQSEAIQMLPHDYKTVAYAKINCEHFVHDPSYPETDYHYCMNGDHYESHQYTVSETVNEDGYLTYVYTCACGYVDTKTDTNIITEEQSLYPTVFVTDGYVLHTGDEVVVYVQLLNNRDGINGACFGIRYTEGLELLDHNAGSAIPMKEALIADHEVYDGYNFLWATGGDPWVGDGYVLKLTFRYTATDGAKQSVSVVYGMMNGTEGGFSVLNDDSSSEMRSFATHSGTISVVEHLPGDVDGSGVVDMMDATALAWWYVGKKTDGIDLRYADVNLDGQVELQDIICIMQSVTGRYGTNLLNSEYALLLDLNGFSREDIETALTIRYYDEEGRHNNWNSEISFEEYEAEMNRRGYTFVGWFTRPVGGEEVDVTGAIKYYDDQVVQTLYAHWEKNKIIFDMNGATSTSLEEIKYDAHTGVINLTDIVPSLSYEVDYRVDGAAYDVQHVYKTFEGWYISETNERVYEIDLATCNLGEITLEARWSTYYTLMAPEVALLPGYAEITDWYWREACTDAYKLGIVDDDVFDKIAKNGFKVYGKENLIQYTIVYENDKGTLHSGRNESYNVKSDFDLYKPENVVGYKFEGWYTEDGRKINDVENEIGNLVLTARWNPIPYEIVVRSVNVNDTSVYNYPYVYAVKPEFAKIYYLYDDENMPGDSSGFYWDKSGKNKLTAATFNALIGNSNFTFKGAFDQPITDNGHSYAFCNEASLVLDENYNCVRIPVQDCTLFAWIYPNQYTVTLDVNLSSKPANVLESNSYTKTIKAYYNEVPGSITMPQGKYYNPVSYTHSASGFSYSSSGVANGVYSVPGDTVLKCGWTPRYSGTYVYTEDGLRSISTTGNYHIISDITLTKAWTPIGEFSGTIDGHGNTISNMQISVIDAPYGGFIGVCRGGTVANLNFANANVVGSSTGNNVLIGTVVGELISGTVSNCKVNQTTLEARAVDSNNIEGSSRWAIVGGIVGKSSGTIERCEVAAVSIYGFSKKHDKGWSEGWNEAAYVYAGGIVGEMADGKVINNTVSSLSKIEGRCEYRINSFWPFGGRSANSRICLGGIIGIRYSSSLVASGNYSAVGDSSFKAGFNSYNDTWNVQPSETSDLGKNIGCTL